MASARPRAMQLCNRGPRTGPAGSGVSMASARPRAMQPHGAGSPVLAPSLVVSMASARPRAMQLRVLWNQGARKPMFQWPLRGLGRCNPRGGPRSGLQGVPFQWPLRGLGRCNKMYPRYSPTTPRPVSMASARPRAMQLKFVDLLEAIIRREFQWPLRGLGRCNFQPKPGPSAGSGCFNGLCAA